MIGMFRFFILLAISVVLLGSQVARAEWVKQNTNSLAWYKDIFFLNDKKGWIVGSDGVVLSTEDGGSTWVQQRKFTSDSINQVYFSDEMNGWLLCERSVYAREKAPPSYLRRTSDGGRTWERVELKDAGRERVTRLFFFQEGKGTAFGEGGVFYRLDEGQNTWKKVQTAIHYLLLDAAYANDKLAAIVGSGGTILFTEDSGYTWERASLLGDTDIRFNAVTFSGKAAWAVGTRGRIFHSSAGGRMWRQQNSTVTANLNDVFFTSPSNGWAVGDNGIIVRTSDGGLTWTDVDSRVGHRLEKVLFAGGKGWVIGFGGTMLTYIDGPAANDPNAKPVLMKRG